MNYVQNDYRHTKTAYRALTLSGIALISAALSTVILPFVLSPIALIFAHLSKGRTKSKHFAARAASVMAILALILNFLIIGFTIYKFNHDEAYRAKIDSLFVQMYGVTIERVREFLKKHTVNGVPKVTERQHYVPVHYLEAWRTGRKIAAK